MARQPDIHYVQIYNPGSTARKLELMPRPKKKKVPLPKPKVQKQRQRILHVDPLAICATAAAGLLLVAMVVGMLRLGTSAGEARALQATVTALQQENEALRQSMEQNYDPEEVAQKAQESGMIPVEEARHVQLELTIPEQPSEEGFWSQLGLFFSELFA